MSETSDSKKQVRLEQSNYNYLTEIKKACDWSVTLGTLANYAIKHGIARTRYVFGAKKASSK